MKLTRRDRVAAALANAILRLVATKAYRDTLQGIIDYGMRSATRDKLQGKRPPPSLERLERLARAEMGKTLR